MEQIAEISLIQQADPKYQRKQNLEINQIQEGTTSPNPNTLHLWEEMDEKFRIDHEKFDPFHLFVYGLILKHRRLKKEAGTVLVSSIRKFPWNWSAWLELIQLVGPPPALQGWEYGPQMNFTDHENMSGSWMSHFFEARLATEWQCSMFAINMINQLLQIFPQSVFLRGEQAIAYYNHREFDVSERLFEELSRDWPQRLDNLDTYSNILYVKENRVQLCALAQRAQSIDKYRPETCCIVGNFYSLRGEHEKALLYFKRALQLNRRYLAAWTLMGHEFLELKNAPAAINAYHRAIQINSCEFRAWYGLGQTYELYKLPLYTVYYYAKAASLRPYDSRMWAALGEVYESIGRFPEAIKAHERALLACERDSLALRKLAGLHQRTGNLDKAAFYYKKNLETNDAEAVEGQETVDALLFLTNYWIKKGDIDQADTYCSRLQEFSGQTSREEARTLLLEIAHLKTVKTSTAMINVLPPTPQPSNQPTEIPEEDDMDF
jgi:anaphase-promoting complex subunit 8